VSKEQDEGKKVEHLERFVSLMNEKFKDQIKKAKEIRHADILS